MMSKTPRLVVFDWEGTLIDTLGQIVETVSFQAKQLGFGEISPDSIRQHAHLGLINALQKWFPKLTLTQQEQLLQSVQQAMLSRPTEICLMRGAKQFVEQLHQEGVFLAIATNKGQASLQRALISTGLSPYFAITRSAGQTPAKPCPQMLQEIMQFCNVDAEHTVMIGDSIIDVEMAVTIGVKAIGVDFYHQQHNMLLSVGADSVFDDYLQLFLYLKQSFLRGV